MCNQPIVFDRRPLPYMELVEQLHAAELAARYAAPGPDKHALLAKATDLRKALNAGHFLPITVKQSEV